MMNIRERVTKKVIGIEGDYSDDAMDSGGKTRFGITEAVARQGGYAGNMNSLPLDTALALYNILYWKKIKGNSLFECGSEALAEEVFEQAVNMGVHRAVVHLQRVLNVLNDRQRHYEDIKADGVMGGRTVSALCAFANKRGKKGIALLVTYLNAMQGAFYIELAERREKDERFIFGWGVNRIARGA